MPPRVEYSLTNAGKSLLPLLHELANWGKTHTAKKIIKEFA
jgi:DNA-binding HxlR family transcriptional regulator